MPASERPRYHARKPGYIDETPSRTSDIYAPAVGSWWVCVTDQITADAGAVSGSASTTTQEITCHPGITFVTEAPST